MNNADYENYIKILKSKLNEKRFFHSCCVADEAKRLAEKYGGNPEKCYTAGLLHDITKNASDEEHLKLFDTFGIMLNDIEKNAKKLWHAISGEAYLKYVLGIDDIEILDAIRYHTTAKQNMSLTAKILYLADFTSRDRDYEDVQVIRDLADKSLNGAIKYALEYSIIDLVRQSRAIHPDTVDAFNEIVSGKEKI
ncbi:MAG: bis(5'-nucleosyl)-tetraphosphatase (symmetrical) YqeK [Clostridia bacterium]|nr:bis(5'-nucleosyl)-tetraphosphatase (symmetrical) YqeK [Clostridia bacterium]